MRGFAPRPNFPLVWFLCQTRGSALSYRDRSYKGPPPPQRPPPFLLADFTGPVNTTLECTLTELIRDTKVLLVVLQWKDRHIWGQKARNFLLCEPPSATSSG